MTVKTSKMVDMSEDKYAISDEAVDAAVDALVASRLGDRKGINGEDFVEAARAALEAAAPHMLREAWQEGYDIGCDRTIDAAPNPYED